MSRIEPLPAGLVDTATTTLSRAFSTDPMFEWMFPDPSTRAKSFGAFVRVPLTYGLRHGRVMHAERGKAVAIWFTPDRPLTVGGLVRSGLLGLPFRIGLGPFGKFMGANGAMDRFHKRYVPEPHWYLLAVGVDPELQGRGVGTALLEETLALADEAPTPAYLETSHERNLLLYERLGFAVQASAPLGKGGPTGWAMRREPRGAGA
jgi:ribosomal protein S18 acetylase RimI-like enzyme